ncbi:protein phosphatase CheZ [Candidatus Nitronereus thalassa]|uniref:Protein phosphatase CheZ n=1 Tax=Candidatus Nitronereus thalassa TaxID=3020898 RepID=A0ABU3K632_9BACT|nr:protein phosphatase CheZ [Candidatus Nitronereus thalassa]MDT7041879.1 protein phosphatase CheZ [Candidatus Nitronereus thalassa]
MLMDRSFETEEKEDPTPLESAEDRTIYEELGELAKFVEATTRAIRDMESPVASTASTLPDANNFLQELATMTEEGTHKVMSLTEKILDSRATVMKSLEETQTLLAGAEDQGPARERIASVIQRLGQDEAQLMEITVALSFQDLVAQRVKKLVTILEDIQHKLLKLVVVFGLKQDEIKSKQDGRGHEMLKQLEASNKTALEQNLVDDILGEFGFN